MINMEIWKPRGIQKSICQDLSKSQKAMLHKSQKQNQDKSA
jgi:hypothetical protein